MTSEFHPAAEQEFLEAAAYYERNVTGLGERFGREVRQAVERLWRTLSWVLQWMRTCAASF